MSWGSVPHPPPGQVARLMGAERSYLGGIWDAEWILEPQWGPEKFNFISVILPGVFHLSASHCP